MNPQKHLAIDGYVDQIPAPGTGWGTTPGDGLALPWTHPTREQEPTQ